MVSWWELPLHKVAAFYETKDCTYQAGKVVISTGSVRDHVDGWHRFQPPHLIQSMMLGPNEAALLQEKLKAISTTRGCHFTKARAHFDTTTLEVNGTRANNTLDIKWSIDEGRTSGLSSNWSDVLLDESGSVLEDMFTGTN